MTCYLTSRDDRFAAAVAGGVVTDLASMAGTSDPGTSSASYELGGRRGGAPTATTRCRRSPQVDDVRTPTLVYHGAADLRCPVGQAQQWHTALRERGVPTRLVLYPEASHLFVLDGPPSHRIDFNRRVVDWVEQYAGAAGRRPDRRRPLAARLAELAEAAQGPGAALGILRLGPEGEDEVVEAAYGRPEQGDRRRDDHRLGVPDRLDDEGLDGDRRHAARRRGQLDLDARSSRSCRSCASPTPRSRKQVTMRHLLTHTSGIDGDVFTDTGRGDDCLEKYVALLERGGAEPPARRRPGRTATPASRSPAG